MNRRLICLLQNAIRKLKNHPHSFETSFGICGLVDSAMWGLSNGELSKKVNDILYKAFETWDDKCNSGSLLYPVIGIKNYYGSCYRWSIFTKGGRARRRLAKHVIKCFKEEIVRLQDE